MCGICGAVDPAGRVAALPDMNERLRHRGPDDEGYVLLDSVSGRGVSTGGPDTPADLVLPPFWAVSRASFDVALGNRRLAVLDRSSAGHMPMSSADGRLWITHNGEIYNYRELRSELESLGHRFRSNTDTEVVLAAYAEWERDCLQRFNGMFAFALWDGPRRSLFCARDRFGVKPFYYFWDGTTFVFASEIKALLAHPAVPCAPNDRAVFDYLAAGASDHTDQTFFHGISQLLPGHAIRLNVSERRLESDRWWRLTLNPDLDATDREPDEQAYARFAGLLKDAVRLRLRSDVPAGSCLSGGLDSSSIVCLVNRLLVDEAVIDRDLIGDHQKTFTARYHDAEIDEYPFSRRVIQQTGADEHTVFPSAEGLWKDLEPFVWHLDEPVNSTSQYAQWSVMRLARATGVTVLLDGQGGDEVLAGYSAYYPPYIRQLYQQCGWLAAVRGARDVGRATAGVGTRLLLDDLRHRLPGRLRTIAERLARPPRQPGHGGSGLQGWQLSVDLQDRFFDRRWQPEEMSPQFGLAGLLERELTTTNLPKLLRYEDRSSMAFSLETRLPFLDYRLVEFVFSLPLEYRLHKGWNKWILRRSLAGVLPDEIRWRRSKLGFPTPEHAWLRLGADLIRQRLREHTSPCFESYLQPGVLGLVCQQPDPTLAATPGLWRMLNLAVWLDLFFGKTRARPRPIMAQPTATS